MEPNHTARGISTGLFDVDLLSGQIFRQGRAVPLQEQPFRVLSVLLEHPGEVVTREVLQSRLWPADTYVSFDEGLNTAIRKLRVFFGESAENPRFIETVPRRGYRFIAPVREWSAAPAGSGTVTKERTAPTEASVLESPRLNPEPVISSKSSLIPRAMLALSMMALLVAASVVLIRKSRSHSPVPARSNRSMLAVLPFQNLSGDPAQEYFSDGLTEETITDLGQLSPAQMGVIARTSAMAYKHTEKTVSQVGRELGVDYILEGSVRREGTKIRVSAQLIRVRDQTHLWAQNYDMRDAKDLIEVQSAIGTAIADQVQLQIAPFATARRAKPRPANPEAYDLYLQGRFYFNQRIPAANSKSIECFKKAIAADPGFAPAYAGLATAYNFSAIDGHNPPAAAFPLGREMAIRAIQLDPSLAEAHTALGMEKALYEFDFPGAKAELLKAIELDPNSASAHLAYSAEYLSPMKQSAEAIAENQKALELDPLSLPANTFMGNTYLYAGDYARAYQQYRHIVAIAPNFAWGHGALEDFLEQTGRFEEAIDERQKADILFEWTPQQASERADALRKALKSGGERGYWRERMAEDLRASHQRPGGDEAAFVIAANYARTGETDEAFKWLAKSYVAREGGELIFLAVNPTWKNLHGDPRFTDLLRRIGLPDPTPSASRPPQ